jgi:hypothetical protein
MAGEPMRGSIATTTPALQLGQLVYTSLPGKGYSLLASDDVPLIVQESFYQAIVQRHWEPYNPPASGTTAAYLHQPPGGGTLFGWLIDDGPDEFGRSIPHFLCFYLEGGLDTLRLEIMLTCLEQGPPTLADRADLFDGLDRLPAPDLWSYQPVRPGAVLTPEVRRQCRVALASGRKLHLFAPAGMGRAVLLDPPGMPPPRRAADIVRLLLEERRRFRRRIRLLFVLLVFALLVPTALAVTGVWRPTAVWESGYRAG